MRWIGRDLTAGIYKICRIQYSSSIKTQELYISHRVKISVQEDNLIYAPLEEQKMVVYPSIYMPIFYGSTSHFYYFDNGEYIDIYYQSYNNFTNKLFIEVDAMDIGSITPFMEKADSGVQLTRCTVSSGVATFICPQVSGRVGTWIDFNTSFQINVPTLYAIRMTFNGESIYFYDGNLENSPTKFSINKGDSIKLNNQIIGYQYTITTNSSYRGRFYFD